MKPVSKNDAPHYLWGNDCDGWRLLDSPSLSVIHERMPAGTREKKHFHEKAQQFFFVLEGEAVFYFENEKVSVKENSGIHIPAGKIHLIANETEEAIEFLVISEPPTKGDREEC
ncbi:MAG TPA: cupin domain-containing protein [Bacteroidia bacterium]|nr:cupin domain-containing protein [Bacteroidia bacterium]